MCVCVCVCVCWRVCVLACVCVCRGLCGFGGHTFFRASRLHRAQRSLHPPKPPQTRIGPAARSACSRPPPEKTHLVADAGADRPQELGAERIPVGRHAVPARHRAQADNVRVGALVALHADRLDGQEHRKRLRAGLSGGGGGGLSATRQKWVRWPSWPAGLMGRNTANAWRGMRFVRNMVAGAPAALVAGWPRLAERAPWVPLQLPRSQRRPLACQIWS